MSLKKTVPMPLLSEDVPTITEVRPSHERTREIPSEGASAGEEDPPRPQVVPAVPRPITADDITVPVHSSIESSLTFEVLRRQSKNDDEGEKK